jgi:putative transposase
MGRKLRAQIPGATYHITTHGISELEVLPNDAAKTAFLRFLGAATRAYGCRTRAYCLMTTHYHLLVTTPKANIAGGMQLLNGRYARWFNREHGRRGHVWESRYHGDAITTDSHLLETIRYVALNPVRSGLSRTPAAWPWSSYASLVGQSERAPFVDAQPVRTLFGSTRPRAVERVRRFVEVAARPDAQGLRLRDSD